MENITHSSHIINDFGACASLAGRSAVYNGQSNNRPACILPNVNLRLKRDPPLANNCKTSSLALFVFATALSY